MPRVAVSANLTPTSAGVVPPTPTTGDPVNHHTYTNSPKTVLVVKNDHATLPQNVTFDVPSAKDVDGQTVPSKVVAVAALTTRYFQLPVGDYGAVVNVDVATADLKLYTLKLA
jgi:hypothetical protein